MEMEVSGKKNCPPHDDAFDAILKQFGRYFVADPSAEGPAWLEEPGTRDITSHVDLTSVQRAAEQFGCSTLGVLDQSYFLLALGLADELATAGASVAATRRRLALKTLVVPGGLGSTHKVLLFGKQVQGPPLRGLSGPSRLT